MCTDLPTWFKIAFFAVLAACMIMCMISISGCQRAEQDSLDQISERVIDKREGIDIQFRPLPREK